MIGVFVFGWYRAIVHWSVGEVGGWDFIKCAFVLWLAVNVVYPLFIVFITAVKGKSFFGLGRRQYRFSGLEQVFLEKEFYKTIYRKTLSDENFNHFSDCYFRVCERHGATNGRSGQGEPEIEKIRFAFQKL